MLLAGFFFLVSIGCLAVWAYLVGQEKNRRALAQGPAFLVTGAVAGSYSFQPTGVRSTRKTPQAPAPPYISVQVADDLFCTLTGAPAVLERFADLMFEEGRTLYYSLEEAKALGAKITYTTAHPYNSPQVAGKSERSEKEIEALVRRRSTLELFLDRDLRLAAYEGDSNLAHREIKLGLLNYTINEAVWRYLPPMGFGEYGNEEAFQSYPDTRTFRITPDRAIKPNEMREFYRGLSLVTRPVVFGIEALGGSVFFEITSSARDAEAVESSVRRVFPEFGVREEADKAKPDADICEASCSFVKASFREPIRSSFEIDPLVSFLEVMDRALERGRSARFEVLARPVHPAGISSVLHYLEAAYPKDGAAGFAALDKEFVYRGAQETIKALRSRDAIWLANIRLFSRDASEGEAGALAEELVAPLRNFESQGQVLVPTDLREAFDLGLDELAALAHFPYSEIPSPYLEVSTMKQKLPPDLYRKGTVRIGRSEARGQKAPVFLPDEVRDRHVYIVGKSGTGKSTLLESIARRDILDGRGVAVIDPHGDVAERLLRSVPEERTEDCVYFDPARSPISLDILSAVGEHETDLLSDDLVTMFRRTSESWGDRMQAILQMTFQTLLRVKGTSFTDITRLLIDEAYRENILQRIDHPQLLGFWRERYDRRQAEPILIRMDRLTTSTSLRHILTQDERSLNFYDVISEGRIFLANLAKGSLGESTSQLIGSLIVSQIQLAAMRQMRLPAEQRIEFSLFVDEVQNYTSDAFGSILSEARKQKLRLTLAHQFVSQLPLELQKAVFGNVGTLIFFSLSPDDLGAARHELGDYEARDAANLPRYHALMRPITAARDTFMFATDPPPPIPETNFAEEIIQNTIEEFGFPGSENLASGIPMPREDLEGKGITASEARTPPPNQKLPAVAKELSFATNTEKILHFLRQAEYLSQPQIIALTGLQPSNASTALKKLVRSGQIRNLDDRRPKIYFVGNSCRPTTHNLLIRDLLVKIHASGFAIQKVSFNETLGDLNPDLVVEFLSGEGDTFPVYFEIDRGTEGVAELTSKAERYAALGEGTRVLLVFEREQDMETARSTIPYPFISYSALDSFASLNDAMFFRGGKSEEEDEAPRPYFLWLKPL